MIRTSLAAAGGRVPFFMRGTGRRFCTAVAGLIACVGPLLAQQQPGNSLCEDQPADPSLQAFCSIAAPEDIVLYPGMAGDQSAGGEMAPVLLISSMAPGRQLYALDPETGMLAAARTELTLPAGAANWGDPDCPPPEELVTHGLDISRRPSGEWQLLAVNHHERESIEFFEVRELPNIRDYVGAGVGVGVGAGPAQELHWRGCVLAADNAQFNDVAALPDGGFLATDPITASWQLPRMLLGSLGMATGKVYRWDPLKGYSAVPDTEGAYPNGILLSPGGDSFYLNLYLDNEVREHDLASGRVLRRVAVTKPDNSSLTESGELLVASHRGSLFSILAAIASPAGERNQIPFAIVAVNRDTFERSVVFSSDGSDIGGGTVAQAVGDDIFIGAFRGDRILQATVGRLAD